MDFKGVKLEAVRFGDSVNDEEKSTESISLEEDLYQNDTLISRLNASILRSITEDDLNRALKRLKGQQIERGEIVWRTVREDVHMNIKAAVTDLVGEPEKKLHTARRRNDQVCTDFHRWCRYAIDNIAMRVKHLLEPALKNEGRRPIVPGYTHLQQAQPVLLQHPFLAFVEQLAQYAGRLLDCRKRMNFFPLGAWTLAGTGLPMDRFMNSGALDFIAPMRNSFGGSSGRGLATEDNGQGSSGRVRGGNGIWSRTLAGVSGRGRGGNGIWSRTLAGVGLVMGGVVGLYLMYKTHHAIERETVGLIRDGKEAGFTSLLSINIEKLALLSIENADFKFSIY